MAEADTLEPPSDNPFEQFDPDKVGTIQSPEVKAANDNPFAKHNPFPDEDPRPAAPQTSATGAFMHGLERGVVPAFGSLPAIGAGAEAGAALGAFGGPIGAAVGGVVGGVAGGFAGATAISTAQNWALSKLPDSWKEAIGQDDRQQKLEETQHGTASFLGGLVPYAVTMRPGGFAKTALPENSTALQRIMSHPATARVFGGALMGGMELGQEAAHGESPDWSKVAISTGFGLVFNKPTRLGERLIESGARRARGALGRPEPTTVVPEAAPAETQPATTPESAPAVPAEPAEPVAPTTARDWNETILGQKPPTVAQAGDVKVMGPGVTEDVFQGAHEQAPSAALTAQETARTERAVTGEPPPVPDVHDVARRMAPETFERYDDLTRRRDAFQSWLAEAGEEDVGAARRHLAATEADIAELAPEVAAAYRRAADATAGATVPEATAEPTAALSSPEQRTAIADDVTRQLIAAGRPEEEARASGQLIAARYEARAARFGGVLGTAEELYKREGALIRGAGRAASGGAPPPQGEPGAIHVTAPKARARDPEKMSLLEFLASSGGIRSTDPLIADLRSSIGTSNKLIPGLGALIRKPRQYSTGARRGGYRNPMTLDQAREAAVEAGYLQDEGFGTGKESTTTINSLLEAMDSELRGKKIYRHGREPELSKAERAEIEEQNREHAESVLNQDGLPVEADELPQHHLSDEEIRDFYQRKPRGLPGQMELPETAPITDAELAQRRADEALKPKVPQKPTDFGLFGDTDLQKELFQARGEIDWLPGGGSKTVKIGDTSIDYGISRDGKSGEVILVKTPRNLRGQGSARAALEQFIAEADRHGTTLFLNSEPMDVGVRKSRLDDFYKSLGFVKNTGRNKDFTSRAEFVRQPQEPREFEQGIRGSIKVAPGRRSIISLTKDANASTFIHETGHDFLEQMMRDAQHPAAPDVLRDDAATIIDWLGVHSAEDIKTKQHEKFARGFEQYMREGVAPSPELAGVFAKFKQWLLNIYQTLKGLGQPINDDIRQVFDRMLSAEPQRTVIAPERPGGPTLADIHEADASLTEAHEAEPAADRVAAERERTVQEPPPEIANEVAPAIAKVEAETAARAGTEPAGENGEGASGRGEVVGGSSGPEPVTESGGVGEGRGEVGGGGSDTTAEGTDTRSTERNAAGQDAGGHPLAATPATLFGPKESPFLDRAGNIRVENLTTSEDVARAIHDAADANNDFIGDRRGVVTDGQVMELADALGLDFDKLNTRKIGQAFNAEQVMAARKLLIESATQVSEAMKKAAIGTDEDVMAYALAKDRHQMIQGQVAGITAEAGRALRAFRNIAGQEQAQGVDQFIRQATGKTLFQLKAEARLGAELQTPQQVSKMMQDAQKKTFGRMVLEYWINGLISGPATHMTYMMGNTILSMVKVGPETAAAAAVGALAKRLGREGETVHIGEVGAQFRGAKEGLFPAMKAAADAFKSGVTTLLPGETPRALPLQPGSELALSPHLDEAAKFSDAMASTFGIVRGIRDGMISGGALLSAGGVPGAPLLGARHSPLGVIPDIELKGVGVLPIGTLVRAPGRFIAAIHSFFRSMNYSMEKNAQAYRMAAEEGLSGTAFDARVGEIRANPSEALMESARFGATELTLMGQGGEFTRALSRLTNANVFGFPLLKFIDPFVHISGNIIDQSIIQRTPVGLLSPELRADLMGKNGNIAQDTAAARMLVGTALSITFGSLAAEGYASGSGPKDPKESAMWRLAGNQAHSVRIGDIWYDVHRLGPLGMVMGIAADMYEVAHQAHEGEYMEAAAHLQHAITQNVLDESFMRGPSDLIKAIEDPGRYGESYIRNFLSSFVPYSVGMSQVARAADPYTRQARTVVDAIKNKIPGLSETLLPRRDIWGEPMPSRDALLMPGVTAIYASKMSQDPVNLAMVDLGISPSQPARKIRNVDLTDEQYDDFARIAGRTTKMRLDTIVRSPDYRSWPNHIKHDVISEVIRQSREAARGMIMMRYPQIVHDAVEARMEKFRDD